jgi:hypothetical protein
MQHAMSVVSFTGRCNATLLTSLLLGRKAEAQVLRGTDRLFTMYQTVTLLQLFYTKADGSAAQEKGADRQ